MAKILRPVVFDTREHAEEFVSTHLRAWIKEIGFHRCSWFNRDSVLHHCDLDPDLDDVDDKFLEWLDKKATFDDITYIVDKYLTKGEHVPTLLTCDIDELPVRKDGGTKEEIYLWGH
jgi:hypothetical protein